MNNESVLNNSVFKVRLPGEVGFLQTVRLLAAARFGQKEAPFDHLSQRSCDALIFYAKFNLLNKAVDLTEKVANPSAIASHSEYSLTEKQEGCTTWKSYK